MGRLTFSSFRVNHLLRFIEMSELVSTAVKFEQSRFPKLIFFFICYFHQ